MKWRCRVMIFFPGKGAGMWWMTIKSFGVEMQPEPQIQRVI